MLQAYVAEHLSSLIHRLLSLLLPLLTGVTYFKNTLTFGLFMRVSNPSGTVRVFLHKQRAIYYK